MNHGMLAHRHKPWLVLYPEINCAERESQYVEYWRRENVAPLKQDYHPRSVHLALDNCKIMPDCVDIFGPETNHEHRDAFWRRYWQLITQPTARAFYPVTVYANIVEGEYKYSGITAIQYWMFYVYNDWRATHEGDWENVVVYLHGEKPIACGYSAHHGGFRLPWISVRKLEDTRPVVFIAQGSHANYFVGGICYPSSTKIFGMRVKAGEFPFTGQFIDFTVPANSYQSATVDPKLEIIPESRSKWTGREWGWLNLKRGWGLTHSPDGLMKLLPKRLRFELTKRIWGAPSHITERRNFIDPFSWVDEECEESKSLDDWLRQQVYAVSKTRSS